ncbi:MAG: sigma-70 family RNA polymerase sigma factor, partial [Caldilineae bacterium]
MPDSRPTDAELVRRCLNGDGSAWTKLVERYARLVHSVPVRHGLTPMEVDDVGQEVFLALARNLHQIENPEALAAWLTTTARRLSWRALQKRAREQPLAEQDLADPAGFGEALPAQVPSME